MKMIKLSEKVWIDLDLVKYISIEKVLPLDSTLEEVKNGEIVRRIIVVSVRRIRVYFDDQMYIDLTEKEGIELFKCLGEKQ